MRVDADRCPISLRWWLSLGLAVLSCCVGAQAAAASPLTPIGTPLVTGMSLSQVAFAPNGSLLAITNHTEQSVSMFSVSPSGAMAQVGTPTPSADPHAPAFSPLGGLLAVVDYYNYKASVFSVSASGALAQIGTPSATEALPDDAEFSPDGHLLAIANSDSFSVSMYSVSAAGVLTAAAASPDTISYFVRSLAFSPDGSRLAVLQEDDILSVYSVSSLGALSLLGSAATGRYPLSVAYSRDGTLLATANTGANSVSVFSVSASGAPIPVGSPTATAGQPYAVAFSPRGDLLLTTGFSEAADGNPGYYSISASSVSPAGELKPVGSPTATGGSPSMAFSPDGARLATTNGTAVSMYSVAAPALQTRLTSGPPAATAATTATFTFDANHPATFECRLDTGSFVPCTTPASYSELTPGTHTFAVRAKDLTGTFASSPASQSWTIDRAVSDRESLPQPAASALPQPFGGAPLRRVDQAAITGLRLSRATFRAARSGAAVKAAAVGIGARVSYTLTAAARVRFTVQRRVRGASVSGRCVERTAANRKRASCVRYVRVLGSSFTRDRPTGSDRFTFNARANDRALSPGRYRLVATPTANGRTGTRVRARFRIAR